MRIGSTPITDIKIGSTQITKVIRNGITYWQVTTTTIAPTTTTDGHLTYLYDVTYLYDETILMDA
jgi:hypothetical protein